jgi:hypothetical protein
MMAAEVLEQPVLDAPPGGPENHAASITPPNSVNIKKEVPEGVPSDLSDLELDPSIAAALEEEEAEEEIEPDHYYGGGKIPVFRPVSGFSVVPLVFPPALRDKPTVEGWMRRRAGFDKRNSC